MKTYIDNNGKNVNPDLVNKVIVCEAKVDDIVPPIKTFVYNKVQNNLNQIGIDIDKVTTVAEIFEAMPENSQLIMDIYQKDGITKDGYFTDMPPKKYQDNNGCMYIYKGVAFRHIALYHKCYWNCSKEEEIENEDQKYKNQRGNNRWFTGHLNMTLHKFVWNPISDFWDTEKAIDDAIKPILERLTALENK